MLGLDDHPWLVTLVSLWCLCIATTLSVLSSASEAKRAPTAEDPAIEQIYDRYKIHDHHRSTNWYGLEDELERYIQTGDPVLHVDSTREYPYSVDECDVHNYPMLTPPYAVVHNKEPHIACPYCGLIISLPYAR